MERIIMESDFINLTTKNLCNEHLSCIIRSRKPHQGVEEKRKWLSDRLEEGHVFRKLNIKAPVFIEYAPLETAWVPIIGDNFYYIYCLWSEKKGKGYGTALMEYCLQDAKEKVDLYNTSMSLQQNKHEELHNLHSLNIFLIVHLCFCHLQLQESFHPSYLLFSHI